MHLPDESERAEYVLNEAGTLYKGFPFYVQPVAWNYDQFDAPLAKCVLDVLLPRVRAGERGDPVLLSRRFSALVNGNDDSGVIFGNWSGEYNQPGATAPSKWTSSSAILGRYVDDGGQTPVRWGQCFAFAGCLNSCLRCLGIPCRPVTNYWSAHDVHFNRTIDKVFMADGSKGDSEDSIWTYHVWNEAFMRRPDLRIPRGGEAGMYDGWQAVDATPQEESGGAMQMGPAPLRACYLGQGGVPYDTEFLIAEVNADERTWTENAETGEFELTKVDKSKVGPFTLTKSVKPSAPLALAGNTTKLPNTVDLRALYKPAEGTLAERANALHRSRRARDPAQDGVRFAVRWVDPNGGLPHVGEPFACVVSASALGLGEGGASVRCSIAAFATSYTGGLPHELKRAEFGAGGGGEGGEGGGARLEAGAKEEWTLTLSAEDYKAGLGGTSFAFEFRCFATVEEASGKKYSWASVESAYLVPPTLAVAPPDAAVAPGGATALTVTLVNKLPFALGAGTLTASGQHHLAAEVTGGQGQEVAAGATATFEVTVTAAANAAPGSNAQVALELETAVMQDVVPAEPVFVAIGRS